MQEILFMRFLSRPSAAARALRPSLKVRAGYLSLLAMALLAAPPQASAGPPLPFNGRVTATWDNIFNGLVAPPANFTGGGPVTYMGNTKQKGTLVLGMPVAQGIYPGHGSVTITAANGDQLSFDYVGFLNAGTGQGIGIFSFTGGTGRFAGATGGGIFDAQIDLSFATEQPMKVVLDGFIDF
jgi:hypothetical protein